jgi:hypothetical protein
MKDFLKVFLLLAAGIAIYMAVFLLGSANPIILLVLRILIPVTVILGMMLLFRKKWSHRLPKDKEKEHLKEYKDQFRKK